METIFYPILNWKCIEFNIHPMLFRQNWKFSTVLKSLKSVLLEKKFQNDSKDCLKALINLLWGNACLWRRWCDLWPKAEMTLCTFYNNLYEEVHGKISFKSVKLLWCMKQYHLLKLITHHFVSLIMVIIISHVFRGKLGNGERWGMANRAISCRRGKSH